MKMKTFRDLLHTELLKDEREFCAYCGTERYRFGCCGEVHYVTYADMDEDWQANMLEAELEEYEKWSQEQESK